jgi:hypothetical protein
MMLMLFYSLYYRLDPRCASVCPVTIHALLHIAKDIRISGPVWAYWAFPMECFCGHIQRAIRSRCYPWTEIDNYVKHQSQLRIITLRYNLDDQLNFCRRRRDENMLGHKYPNCRCLVPIAVPPLPDLIVVPRPQSYLYVTEDYQFYTGPS